MRKSRQILFCPLVSLVALELIIIFGWGKNAYTFHALYLSWQGSLGLYFPNLNGIGTAAQTVQALLIRLNLSCGNYSFSLCISFLNKRVLYIKMYGRDGGGGACWEAWKMYFFPSAMADVGLSFMLDVSPCLNMHALWSRIPTYAGNTLFY